MHCRQIVSPLGQAHLLAPSTGEKFNKNICNPAPRKSIVYTHTHTHSVFSPQPRAVCMCEGRGCSALAASYVATDRW